MLQGTSPVRSNCRADWVYVCGNRNDRPRPGRAFWRIDSRALERRRDIGRHRKCCAVQASSTTPPRRVLEQFGVVGGPERGRPDALAQALRETGTMCSKFATPPGKELDVRCRRR